MATKFGRFKISLELRTEIAQNPLISHHQTIQACRLGTKTVRRLGFSVVWWMFVGMWEEEEET
jgi:hypothetical protein